MAKICVQHFCVCNMAASNVLVHAGDQEYLLTGISTVYHYVYSLLLFLT